MGLDSMSVWRRGTTLAEEKERTNARVMHATTLHFIKNARDFRSRNTAAKFRKATWYNCCRVQFIRADRNETPSRAWNLANKSRVKKIQNSFFRSYPIWLIFFSFSKRLLYSLVCRSSRYFAAVQQETRNNYKVYTRSVTHCYVV